ncbi:MAG: hypothetical protein KA369_05075 [Spirochaetes bacterium]|nr:hypothetical protein [Spirochaetota bacterium]
MKKTIPLILYIMLILTVPALSPGKISGGGPFELFPALEAQAAANLPQGMDAARARELLGSWYDGGNSELVRGMEMVLAGEGETNHALALLLHLLDRDCYERGETMTAALALANNHLYALVTPAIREEIKKDIVKHYRFYRKIIAWQKKSLELPYDLSRVPLVAQIYWADRRAYPPEDITYPVRTLSDYHEYVDSIETLEFFHNTAVERKLYLGESVTKIGRNVAQFVHKSKAADGLSQHLYNPDEKTAGKIIGRMPQDPGPRTGLEWFQLRYMGIQRNICDFIWTNYQRQLLERTGHSVGLCEVSSLIEMAAFKGMGIPAGLMVRFPPKERPFPGHVFAMYYDPFLKKWKNLEMIRSWDKPLLTELVIHKPVWHHRVKDLQVKVTEKAPANRFFKVLDFGIPNGLIEKVFMTNRPSWNDTLFSRAMLPDDPRDRDGDGIPDFEEKILGTDPSRPDSAGDGVSDLWKLNHGYDPGTPITQGSLDSPPMDGLGGAFSGERKMTTVTVKRAVSPREDVPEINTMSAARLGDNVYVHVTFHNDIRKCKRKDNYIWFGIEGGRGRVKGFDLVVDGNGIGQNNNVRAQEPDGYRDLRGISITDVELMVPVRYLDGASSVKIVFFTALERGELILPVR